MMETQYNIIEGGHHTDDRGTIFFFNDFDMKEVKRFYRIKHHDTSIIRGWRGHKIEQRWFQVSSGSFEIKLLKIDNWQIPDPNIKQDRITLTAEEDSVLHIPAGYATSLQALSENSELIVFADYPISHAKNDDYLYPLDYFKS
ncbi:hypothetical protein D3C87_1186300 [compost metagenome]